MRKFLWGGASYAAFCLGCTTVAEGVRNVILEPAEYSWRIDNCVDRKRNRALADQAWAGYVEAHPPKEGDYPPTFQEGFKDGFADYLFAGGSGNPPPVPPRYYWRPEFENPEGQFAMRQWYAGFSVGAAAARRSGLRQLVTVPPSVALPTRTPVGYHPALPVAPSSGRPPGFDAPRGRPETLPPPRQVPPPDGTGGATRGKTAAPPESPPAPRTPEPRKGFTLPPPAREGAPAPPPARPAPAPPPMPLPPPAEGGGAARGDKATPPAGGPPAEPENRQGATSRATAQLAAKVKAVCGKLAREVRAESCPGGAVAVHIWAARESEPLLNAKISQDLPELVEPTVALYLYLDP